MQDTLWCMEKEGGFVPPLWTMCAESVSSLLIMINFSGNFLIYCSMLPPFKEALTKVCTFFCFWRSASCSRRSNPSLTGSADDLDVVDPTCAGTGAVEETTIGNNNRTSGGRAAALMISTRSEIVPGEPPKTARILKLWSRRRKNDPKRPKKSCKKGLSVQINQTNAAAAAEETVPLTLIANNNANDDTRLANPANSAKTEKSEIVVCHVTIEGTNGTITEAETSFLERPQILGSHIGL
jgi:hypothetical protein